jgi:uncharacterized protein
MLNLRPVVRAVLDEYCLSPSGIHGVAHWARVMENGVRLAEMTGAKVDVVQLFAVFHDCRRVNEEAEPTHGIRAAKFAAKLRGALFELNDDDFDLLFVACAGHARHPVDDDPTVQTCWDADRLDLGRMGAKISPLWLGESTIEECGHIMEWADRRAKACTIPGWLEREWGIKTDRWRERPGVRRRKKTTATPGVYVLA